jgi:hypothetical protein
MSRHAGRTLARKSTDLPYDEVFFVISREGLFPVLNVAGGKTFRVYCHVIQSRPEIQDLAAIAEKSFFGLF